ncbi:MAG: leucine-rich repeat domain-containing protein [Treponema sp.]|jgi:hypothetical protein|nr:leucine-rich repeat domain-containing protein [Treponema sp.]
MGKNRSFMTGMAALLLTFGLVLAGCDNPAGGDSFTAQTDNSAANDAATLGLVGTSVSSNDESVATAAITDGKIAITSVAPGTAVITVSADGYTAATILVEVAADGAITIGTITKGGPDTPQDSEWVEALENALQNLGNTTAENLATVVLEAITIVEYAYDGDWEKVNAAVNKAQKYVILDLSNCTFKDNEVAGSVYGNTGMNIIGDNEYIKGIILPASVISIGDYTFSYCTGLTSVTIPGTVTSIGDSAFSGCTGLTSVTIPGTVTSIGERAFFGTGLTSITVDSANSAYSSENGVLFNKGKTDLIQYPAGKSESSYTIPAGVTSIGDSAFSGCTGLTSVTIPAGVTTIGDRAFADCTALTSVTIPTGVTSIGAWAFSGTGLTSVTIPAGVTSIGERAFSYCTGLTNVTFEENSEIGEDDFGEYAFPPIYSSDNGGSNLLRYTYLSGGAGTYIRTGREGDWIKQQP